MTPIKELIAIFRHGYDDAKYGYTYIDPNWSVEELSEYARGYILGLQR